jgi:Protein of unknown function (DUF559)/AbiEi antitoxin C-terminal domain
MGGERVHGSAGDRAWGLARRQRGVVTRAQLLDLGFTPKAIEHKLERVTPAPHSSWGFRGWPARDRSARYLDGGCPGVWTEGASQPSQCRRTLGNPCAEVSAHRGLRAGLLEAFSARRLGPSAPRPANDSRTAHLGIPATSPIRTLADLASCLPIGQVEAAVNEADKRNLVDPEELRSALGEMRGQSGVANLRRLLDRRTFVLTDSELERRFLPIARAAGLPAPDTGRTLNGFRVDFFWPTLGLVVETDGLRYHRTPGQQARDRRRDQVHTAAGLTTLRFTHAQVRFERPYVRATLSRVARRLVEQVPH